MKELSNAEAALLGLLSEGARHPYQIEKDVQYRDMRYWTDLSISSIYKLLRQLEVEGLVDLNRDFTVNNRMRKVYCITEAGKKALQKRIGSLFREAEHLKWQIDVATYNLCVVPKEMRRKMLDDYRQALTVLLAGYRELETFMGNDECPVWHRAVSRRPQFLLQGELSWLEDFNRELEEAGEL